MFLSACATLSLFMFILSEATQLKGTKNDATFSYGFLDLDLYSPLTAASEVLLVLQAEVVPTNTLNTDDSKDKLFLWMSFSDNTKLKNVGLPLIEPLPGITMIFPQHALFPMSDASRQNTPQDVSYLWEAGLHLLAWNQTEKANPRHSADLSSQQAASFKHWLYKHPFPLYIDDLDIRRQRNCDAQYTAPTQLRPHVEPLGLTHLQWFTSPIRHTGRSDWLMLMKLLSHVDYWSEHFRSWLKEQTLQLLDNWGFPFKALSFMKKNDSPIHFVSLSIPENQHIYFTAVIGVRQIHSKDMPNWSNFDKMHLSSWLNEQLGISADFFPSVKPALSTSMRVHVSRIIQGKGMHRALLTNVTVTSTTATPNSNCTIMLVDILPPAMFVDADELSPYVNSKTWIPKADVEMPLDASSPLIVRQLKALNSALVKTTTNNLYEYQLQFQLPIHMRYQAACYKCGGYAPVTLLAPRVYYQNCNDPESSHKEEEGAKRLAERMRHSISFADYVCSYTHGTFSSWQHDFSPFKWYSMPISEYHVPWSEERIATQYGSVVYGEDPATSLLNGQETSFPVTAWWLVPVGQSEALLATVGTATFLPILFLVVTLLIIYKPQGKCQKVA